MFNEEKKKKALNTKTYKDIQREIEQTDDSIIYTFYAEDIEDFFTKENKKILSDVVYKNLTIKKDTNINYLMQEWAEGYEDEIVENWQGKGLYILTKYKDCNYCFSFKLIDKCTLNRIVCYEKQDSKYICISTQEEREQLLQSLFKQEYKKLKRKAFYRKHRNFLHFQVEIIQENLSKINANGLYEFDEETNIHRIKINKNLLDRYFSYKKYNIPVTNLKDSIRNTIRHELIHAFTKEFGIVSYFVKNIEADSSPFFASFLYYFDTKGNNCLKDFKKSTTFKQIQKYKNKSFEKFDECLRNLLLIANIRVSSLDNINKKDSINFSNFVYFDSNINNTVLEKIAGAKIKSIKNKISVGEIAYFFKVGCMVDLNNIDNILQRKIQNKVTDNNKIIDIIATDKFVYNKTLKKKFTQEQIKNGADYIGKEYMRS